MKKSHLLALATLFAGGWIAAWGLGRYAAPAEETPEAAALEAVESPLRLEAEVERREREIADLRAEVRLLEGRLAALASERSEVSESSESEEAAVAAEESVKLVNELYRIGLTDFQNVLDTERSLFEQQDALAESEGLVSRNLIAIYRSLGGGWSP